MDEQKAVIKTTITMEVEIDSGWVEFVTGGEEGMVDVFLRNGYCGYWMEGIEHDPKLGWLAYEFGATDRSAKRSEKEVASKAWHAGEKLPENFHALNLDAAIRGWKFGVEKYGLQWYENGDGCVYDCVMQLALLGEVTYG